MNNVQIVQILLNSPNIDVNLPLILIHFFLNTIYSNFEYRFKFEIF